MISPPLVCPRPGSHNPGPDCPLWDARQRIQFRRSIEADGAARPSMGELVWAECRAGKISRTSPGGSPSAAENPDGIDGRQGAQVSGGFSGEHGFEHTQELATALRIGAPPVDLRLIRER